MTTDSDEKFLRQERHGAARMTVPLPPKASSSGKLPQASPSRWRTREFCVYYTVIVTAVSYMTLTPYWLSQSSNPNWYLIDGWLREGWIGNRQRDVSDAQYRQFRSGLPSLLLLGGVHLILSHGFRLYNRQPSFPPSQAQSQTQFLYPFCLTLLLVLHGASAFKVLALLYANFRLSHHIAGRPYAPYAFWALNLSILFANKHFDGYYWSSLAAPLRFLDSEPFVGLVPRWHITFNITMLRLVSYSMDLHWLRNTATDYAPIVEVEENAYQWPTFVSYVLYPPLYIAGPIMNFSDFAAQIKGPRRLPRLQVAGYAVRFLFCLLTMELVLHFIYVGAIKDARGQNNERAWHGNTPFELMMIGFWNLIVVWLKLLLPWRFFRLWAMADGIDPPENMVRCMANNYSVTGFWRSWHRSYNLWIIRYIYVPLGGAQNVFLATLLVFTFVALWHDLSLTLLTWGWVVSIFVVPELIARRLLPESKFGQEGWYRHATAFGGVCNVMMLLVANLIGFAIGLDGTKYLLHQIFGNLWGITTFAIACGVMFAGVQLMLEYRQEELRQGIYLRC